MERDVLIVTISLALLVPIISIAYVVFRLKFRIDQLRNFFSLPGIRNAYISSKGESIGDWSEEQIKKKFEEIFSKEVSREYGKLRFVIGIAMGTIFASLAVVVLAPNLTSVLTQDVPSDLQIVHFALLGAYLWTLWLLLSGLESLNLTPLSFFWIPFRFVVALVVGTLASMLFKGNSGMAGAFVLAATAMPYPELLSYLKSRLPGMGKQAPDDTTIRKIQGMHRWNIETLEPLGIRTTQELAYSDPLMLLFRTNLAPKVLIDWMDQALLYNYVGDKIEKLRSRGVRGAIELLGAEGKPVHADLAKALGITQNEFDHLRNMFGYDFQVELISRIWNEFEIS